MPEPLEAPWSPVAPDDLVRLFAGSPFPWWIAGGYAIELAVGHAVRAHDDLDVLLLRRDHLTARAWLAGWDCHAADPPGSLRPWQVGEVLAAAVHDIWVREHTAGPWRFQLMLDEADGTELRTRRNPLVRLPLAALGRRSPAGLPYLAPAVQLFYKAKGRRPKDELDFEAVLPLLDADERAWLHEAIAITHGADHPWLPRIRKST